MGQHDLRRSRVAISFIFKDRRRLGQYAAKSCDQRPRIGRRRLDSPVEAVMLRSVDQYERIASISPERALGTSALRRSS